MYSDYSESITPLFTQLVDHMYICRLYIWKICFYFESTTYLLAFSQVQGGVASCRSLAGIGCLWGDLSLFLFFSDWFIFIV